MPPVARVRKRIVQPPDQFGGLDVRRPVQDVDDPPLLVERRDGDANLLQGGFREFSKCGTSGKLHQTLALVTKAISEVFGHNPVAADQVSKALVRGHGPGSDRRVADSGPARHQDSSGWYQTRATFVQANLCNRFFRSLDKE